MSRIRIVIISVVALAAFACSPSSRTIKVYEKDGIQFSHFSNWIITEDSPIEGNSNARSIHLEGPNEALVTFICLPASSSQTLEEFAAAVAQGRAKGIEEKLGLGPIKPAEVSKGTSAAIRSHVGGQQQNGIKQHFNINLLGLDVPHEATFFAIDNGRYKVIIMTQVASENAREAYPAFDLTLGSCWIKDLD